jgi:hypothetical protein
MATTKAEFQVIAQDLKQLLWTVNDDEAYGVSDAIKTLTTSFHKTNPRFDRVKFLEACGIPVSDSYVQSVLKSGN